MGRVSIVLVAILLASFTVPAWAVEDGTDFDVYEVTFITYKDGAIYSQLSIGCAPGHVSYSVVGDNNTAGTWEGTFSAFSFGDNPELSENTAAEIARFGDNLQHVSFGGGDFMFYSTEGFDWVEIELKSCHRSELEPYRAVLQMSEELDESIMARLFQPASKLGFAVKEFLPISAATVPDQIEQAPAESEQ